MGRFIEESGRLVWREDRHTLIVEAWGEGVVRVRATVNPSLADRCWALVRTEGTAGQVTLGEEEASLRSGGLEARVSRYGQLRFFRDGAPLLEEPPWRPGHPLYPQSREFTAVDGDLHHIEVRFKPQEGERFYGLGQHRHGYLDQKGLVVDLEQRNAEVNIPFLLSSRRYGFLWHNPGVGRVELGGHGTRWVAEGAREVDYLLLSGRDYAQIMHRYVDLTGHAPMLPDWASGFWQCKLRYSTQEEILSVAREHKSRGLPLSVIVVDYFHWPRQGEWTWDAECWPDPEGMIEELEEMGVKLMVSIWPTVNPLAETAAEMRERGFLVATDRGNNVVFPFVDTYDPRPTYMHHYDATNPEARRFLWERVKTAYHDRGIEVFWLDACEPQIYPMQPGNIRYYVGSGLEAANIYPMLHARGFYEGMREAGQERVCNLARSAWIGSQRWGAAVWSGDIPSDWPTLRAQIKAGLNIMMSGIPWWTTDIGGFFGGYPEDPEFRELVVRWFQYGLFCPLFRLHGHRLPDAEGEGKTGAENEVWSFGEGAYDIIRGLLAARERMRPYIMRQMETASETGLPPMRPLFFDYPDEGELYGIDDEFLFGPDIVVAPVVQPGATGRRVYLPAGSSWIDARTEERVDPGVWFEAEAPLELIPVYLREGATVRPF
jgi:alpha-D-xyloside xylohydrolase